MNAATNTIELEDLIPEIDDVDTARRCIAAHLDALRRGMLPAGFHLSEEVYDLLDATGELAAWEEEEAALEDDHGVYSEAADWYTCGRDQTWLERTSDDGCEFMLGAPQIHWLWNGEARGTLFVSQTRLSRRRTPFPEFDVPLCIDSGGFTQITMHGRYTMSPEEYVCLVRRVARAGCVKWAAIQDWMCEEKALRKTGLTVLEHQRRTVESFLLLRSLAPEIRWLPVVQGQTVEDYLRHVDMYAAAGVDLTAIARVGVGSVCRRSRSAEIDAIVAALSARGLRLHAFGGKSKALARNSDKLRSADSMAWSLRGRFETATTGARDSQGRALQNSQEFAEEWRREMNACASHPAKRLPFEVCVRVIDRIAARLIAQGHPANDIRTLVSDNVCALVEVIRDQAA